jgi:hypothetical protein
MKKLNVSNLSKVAAKRKKKSMYAKSIVIYKSSIFLDPNYIFNSKTGVYSNVSASHTL